jgi:hypothetical protein
MDKLLFILLYDYLVYSIINTHPNERNGSVSKDGQTRDLTG